MTRWMAVVVVVLGAALAGCTSEGSGGGGGAAGDGITCDPAADPSRTISCVQDFSPGDGAGFGEDDYPDVIYGEPLGKGTYSGSLDVLSLGKGGSITVGFGGGAIQDGPGADFIVFENAFYKGNKPELPFHELGQVSVSEDGETWATFDCKTDSYPYDGCSGWRAVLAGSEPGIDAFDPETAGGDPFDLADVGLQHARFVRIVDVSNTGSGNNAGFDLDAITIVHPAP